jgi:hypothetical protein
MTDPRPPISEQARQLVAQAFRAVPADKRGALLVIADEQGARAHLAARLGDTWKVAFTGGRAWSGDVQAQVAIVGTW